MNPFSPGDRVQYKAKNRRNGNVVYLFCNDCTSCKDKKYNLCAAENEKKDWVLASFRDTDTNTSKRYRYEYKDLELEEPLPLKEEEKVHDLSAKDIRPLGVIQIDIPLIAIEGDKEELEEEVDLSKEIKTTDGKAVMGLFFDQYVNFTSRMERPI